MTSKTLREERQQQQQQHLVNSLPHLTRAQQNLKAKQTTTASKQAGKLQAMSNRVTKQQQQQQQQQAINLTPSSLKRCLEGQQICATNIINDIERNNVASIIKQSKISQNQARNQQALETSKLHGTKQQLIKQTTQLNVCAGCRSPIRERYMLVALDKRWHEDCLKCVCCECRLGEVGSTLFVSADKILCRRDFLRIFCPSGRCSACKQNIAPYELVMRARQHAYHLNCFSCEQCKYRFCVGDKFCLTNESSVRCIACCENDSTAITNNNDDENDDENDDDDNDNDIDNDIEDVNNDNDVDDMNKNDLSELINGTDIETNRNKNKSSSRKQQQQQLSTKISAIKLDPNNSNKQEASSKLPLSSSSSSTSISSPSLLSLSPPSAQLGASTADLLTIGKQSQTQHQIPSLLSIN